MLIKDVQRLTQLTEANSLGVIALRSVLIGVWGAVLYVGRGAFIPVTLALLFALILCGTVERLHRLRLPRHIGATLVLALALGVVALATNLLWEPAQQWYASAPQTMKTVRHKLQPLARAMSRFDSLRQSAQHIASTNAPGPAAAGTPALDDAGAPAPVLLLSATRQFAMSAVTFVVVTWFLLAGGPPMLARLAGAVAGETQLEHWRELIDNVRVQVGRFYVTTALINIGLGTATAVIMAMWDMPTPLLWGAMAAVFNFIPYAGSAVTLLLLTLVAFVSFDTLSPVLGVAASYLLLATLEGQLVQPLLVGRRLDINPLLIFLGLWFGGCFWGIAGVILATPLLLTLKIMADKRHERPAPIDPPLYLHRGHP